MGKGQQNPRHPQFLGPPFGETAEGDIRAAVWRPGYLDIPPPDPTGRLTPLERLVDRLLRGETDGDVLSRVGPGAAVLGLGGREEPIEDMRALVREHRPRARDLDEIDADSHRAHGAGRATKRRRR